MRERADWIGPGAAFLGLLIAAAADFAQSERIAVIGFLVVMGAWLFAWRRPKTLRQVIRLAIDDEAIFINGEPVLKQEKIIKVAFHDLPSGECRLLVSGQPEIQGRNRRRQGFQFVFPNRQSVREFVTGLRTPTDESFFQAQTASFELWHIQAAALVGIGALLWIEASGISLWFAGIGLLVLSACVNRLAQVKIAVGNDGLHIERLYRRRFIPLIDIRTVDEVEQTLALTLHSGKRVRVTVTVPDLLVTLRAKVMRAIEQKNLRALTDRPPPELERGERSTVAWIAALKSIGATQRAEYRQAATSAADLYRVVDDQNVSASLRAASAVGLRVLDPEHAGAKIGLLAVYTANPMLRVALQKIAEGAEDSELEECLEGLIAADTTSSKRQ